MNTTNTNNKRKLDDYATTEEPLTPNKMRKDQINLPSTTGSTRVQFFVRLFSGGKTLVLQSDSTDSVESVHAKIQSITGIPADEQRLLYRGKQLQPSQFLTDCDVQNDVTLQLLARMRSTAHPKSWQLISDLRSLIFYLCKTNRPTPCDSLNNMVTKFLTMTADLAQKKDRTDSDSDADSESKIMVRKKGEEAVAEHLAMFMSSSVPAAMVMLYISPVVVNKDTADKSIRKFISSCESDLPKEVYKLCGPIMLEFCRLLRGAAGADDALYCFCRSRFGVMLESVGGIMRCANDGSKLELFFPFVRELAGSLSRDLGSSVGSSTKFTGLSLSYVHDFSVFMRPLSHGIQYYGCQIALPLPKESSCGCEVGSERVGILQYREQIEGLHHIFCDLLEKVDTCLKKLERQLGLRNKPVVFWWSQYLVILKELHSISKLYEGLEKVFWQKMMERKVSLCFLVVKFAKKSEDYQWVLEHREVTNFEVRRHLAMMMLPEVRDENEELYEMLIDRSQLLEESFEYIGHADPLLLRGGLFMEFKNEEATGPGVLREWFFLVCQAIFNPQNALFVAGPNDRRRFLPNPASKVDPLHLEYFVFSGRMIALALMHKVQISIALDRVFFLQLAGKRISLEDIRDADPYLYRGCKQILEMDPKMVDQDTLGLTFVSEVEEMGSTKVVELRPNGKNTAVNSKNRSDYVNLLIQHRFAKSIAQQVAHFARGFADIITTPRLQKSFFQSLDLHDLDWMLNGRKSDVSVEDWKAHTDYIGYKKTDPQISWFWKIVARMSAEQRKVLLFFWTSIKALPIEGFSGLDSRLYIYRTSESCDHLPSSHTCFYRLCFPPYKSMTSMQKQLHIITQEHVGCSFGIG